MPMLLEIVNMRACVKAAKVQVIHKLTRVIQKLKTKKGTEEQKEQNLRKAQRRLDEVFAIKELNIDRVSKFSLQNTTSFDEASKQPTATLEFRSLARLAEHKLLATKVKNFREEHSDWQDLAAFLYAKQTGRRFKTKKQKLRAAKKGSKFLLGAKTTAEEGDPKGAGKDEVTEEQSHSLSADDSNEDDDEDEKENRSSSADDSDENVGPGESADDSDENEGPDEKEEVNIRKNHREKENTISDNNDHDSSDEESNNEERGDEGSDESEREHRIDRKSDVHKRTGDRDQGEKGPAKQDIQEESDEEGDEHLEADTDEDEDSDEQERSNTSAEEKSFEEEDGGDDMNKDTSEEESEEEESAYMKTSAKKHLKENNKSDEPDRTAVLFQKPREPNVVKDPFFVCDDEDDDAKDATSGHWIPESALERANSELLRGGKFRRRGGEREPRSERPFTAEDDRWLIGEFNDDFANGFRGRRGGGFSRGRGDSRRGKEGSFRDRGNSSYRGRGDRGRGSSWRGQGRDSDSRGRGRDSDSFRGRGRDSGSFRGRGRDSDSSRGRGRDSDSFRGRGRDSGSFRGRGTDSDSFRGRGLSRGGRGDSRRDQGHSGTKKTENQCDFSHPSWEAKRKRKEMEKMASFSGKKIKFDD
ncbi:serum response factor-binding protein 1-like isoform X2 [Littorina saxatilis]|uniref:serum response factor-binding protein 1-like isoform X2 n=1 Tax=Littorina saxatilis TaxID=31220 RepID=UPI0038B61EEC